MLFDGVASAVMSDDPNPLENKPFPYVDDANRNYTWAPLDHSYPRNYYELRETFVRPPPGEHQLVR